jgi:hypothetical protein
MIQLASGILGAAAATLAFGAVHLEVAAGNDMLGPRQVVTSQSADTIAASIDRAGKGDRLGNSVSSESPSFTLSFRMPGVTDSSVMMRVPAPEVARSTPPSRNSGSAGRRVACEPSVSVLTPIAKQLDAARCVT